MTLKEKAYSYKFLPGNIKQWKLFKNDNVTIWLAGDNLKDKYDYLVKNISKYKKLNKGVIKNIIQNIDDHFGLVYISNSLMFAAVDCIRSYPIFWKKKSSDFIFSSQAINIVDIKNDNLNHNQLTAFRTSGYTIDDGTLWDNVKNLNPGNFLFINNNDNYSIEEYFSYTPWKQNKKPYSELKKELKHEINNLLKNSINKANGRTIVIPLSAGLDSRLIASGLKNFKYSKVKCFSYGLKNNFESKASKAIADKLGFKWKFIEINQRRAKNFYSTSNYKNYMNYSLDGCATSTIQGLYAINKLLKENYISADDIIINGNSGDFISGGHAPVNLNIESKNINSLFEKVFEQHFIKHYSLWQNLLNAKNKEIIKNLLKQQIKNNIKNTKINYSASGIAEYLEFQNRQTKYVINSQRIYEFYNLKWQLPLWDKSFIKFWSDVPSKYKIHQKLYKDVLNELNMGGVWGEEYDTVAYVSPKWVRFLRIILKAHFLFIGRKKWHNFERKYLEYWMDNICGQSILPYREIINNTNISRHYVSWLTIFAEEIMLNSNWQNIDIGNDFKV